MNPVAEAPVMTVFILVKSTRAWLDLPADARQRALAEHVEPTLKAHANEVTMRSYDIEFYSARVTDIWIFDATSHHAYETVIEALRETPFWDRYFEVIDILPGVENVAAKDFGRAAEVPLPAR